MEYKIEVYKGQTISYNDSLDKFTCEISIEDKHKATKRQSLDDVRKEIDTFIKLNLDFKPFKIIMKDSYGDSFSVKNISAIRTDGKFVAGDGNYKSHLGAKEMKNAMVYDFDIVEAKQKLEDIFEQARVDYKKGVAELCEKLVPMDLSKYQHIMNPNE
jgi:hypothetical protein